MLIVNVFNPAIWQVWFAGLPFNLNANGEGKYLKDFAKEEGADKVFNLALFNMPTKSNLKKGVAYRTINYLKSKTKDLGYGGVPERVSIGWENVVGGQHACIKNGVIQRPKLRDKRAKNFAGLTETGWYVHVQSYGITEASAVRQANAWVKKHYNTTIKTLLLEDGGGSVGSYCTKADHLLAPMREGKYGRKVASVACARLKIKLDRTLKLGDTGDDVRILQTLINVEPDGSYGPQTQKQVSKIQASLGHTGAAGQEFLEVLSLM